MDPRAALAKKLGRDIGDAGWQLLVDEGSVGELEFGRTIDWLAQRWRKISAAVNASAAETRQLNAVRRERVSARLEHRASAISRISVAVATNEIRMARSDLRLSDESLLAPEAVEGWVLDLYDADEPGADGVRRPGGNGRRYVERLARNGDELATLSFAVPIGAGAWHERRLSVRPGSRLGRLAAHASQLAERYRWDEIESVLVILTGLIPWVAPIRAELVRRRVTEQRTREMGTVEPAAVTVGTRLTIEVDPVVTPTELMDWYAECRRKIVGSSYQPLGERNLAVAAFVAESPAAAWSELTRDWNRGCPPGWRYDGPGASKRFARDARATRRRLMSFDYGELSDTV